MKSVNFMFSVFVRGLDRSQNTIETFWLRNHASSRARTIKQKTVKIISRGLSNLNLGMFVCSFDVCRASWPFPF